MWTNGSRSRIPTPAKARVTGKPSPSNPLGPVVTDRTGRSVWRDPQGYGRGLTVPRLVAGIDAAEVADPGPEVDLGVGVDNLLPASRLGQAELVPLVRHRREVRDAGDDRPIGSEPQERVDV